MLKPFPTLILLLSLAVVAGAYYVARGARTMEEVHERRMARLVDWDNVVDDPSRKLTISWMGPPNYISAREGTVIERYLEERFNVELKPVFIDPQAYDRRLPLMFCGGNVPDIYWNGDPIVVQRNIHHGFVLEAPYEVILKHAPHYVEKINAHGSVAWLYSYWNGRNYGLPTYNIRLALPNPGMWRKDWLRNVGIEKVPETLDEFHDALFKFVHEDPDGDGEDNTIGLECVMEYWWSAFYSVFGCYGVMPFDWMLRSGEVVWGGVLPETREALALLHEWYEEGLIDPEFASAKRGQQSKFLSGRCGYMRSVSFPSVDARRPNSTVSITKQLNPDAEFVVDRLLRKEPGAPKMRRVWGPGGHIICFARHLAEEPEKVLRVLRMFDEMYADLDTFLMARLGPRGVQWEYTPAEGIVALPPYDARNATKKALMFINLDQARGFFSCCGAPPEWVNRFLAKPEFEFREEYQRREWAIYNVIGKPDVTPSAGLYLSDLRKMQITVFTEIIRGDREVEYFDTFVRHWRERGGDILTREANELYRAKADIFRRVGIAQDPDAPLGHGGGE